MEVSFWQFLAKSGTDALPLKQRIPEVALFRGDVLESCYFSTQQRGLLQRRPSKETSRGALLERLLSCVAHRADGADVGSCTPVAVLRCWAANAVPQAVVLTASELLDLLERPNEGRFSDDEEWSLQSLVLPGAGDLRVIAVYSRDTLGEERLDIVGRSFSEVYAVDDASRQSHKTASAMPSLSMPEKETRAIRAKVLALVEYVQRFHLHSIESLVLEFVVDCEGRIVLTGFWRATLFAEEVHPMPVGYHLNDRLANVSGRSSPRGECQSAECPSALASTTLPSAVSPHMASLSTDTGPTSCAASLCGTAPASRPVSAGGACNSSRPPSPNQAGRPAAGSRPQSAESSMRLRANASTVQEISDMQIAEDDGDGEDIEEVIRRMEAAQPRSKPTDISKHPRWSPRVPPPPEGIPSARKPGGLVRPCSARARLCPQPPESQPQSATQLDRADTSIQETVATPLRSRVGSSCSLEGSQRVTSDRSKAVHPPRPHSTRHATPRSSMARRRIATARAAVLTPKCATTADRPGSATDRMTSTWPHRDDCERSSSPTSPRRRTVHSQQLLSRHQSERSQQTRLLSTLGRQLERYRDVLPVWLEQRKAVNCVVAWAERKLHKQTEEIDKLLAQKDEIDRYYQQRYDALVRGLARERDKALASAREKRKELERSLQVERETSQILGEEEAKNQALRATLEKTVAQLNSVRTDMLTKQAQEQEDRTSPRRSPRDVPEIVRLQHRAQGLETQAEHLAAETDATKAEVSKVECQLDIQRSHTKQLQDFIRRITSGNCKNMLDSAVRGEAAALLAEGVRLSNKVANQRLGADDPGWRSSTPHKQPFSGRRCVACDHNDARLISPGAVCQCGV